MSIAPSLPGTIKTNSIDTYRKAKLKMLKSDFKIRLTDEEIAHANTLTTEVKIDRFCLTMLNKYWG
jgi:hypothetical protein